MQTVVYSCPFVPAEWIAAHGLRPRRIMPRSVGGTWLVDVTGGMCAYAQAFIQEAVSDTQASAVVVTTACDQMRRGSELIARQRNMPLFLMNVPSTWTTVAAQELYRNELERLGRFMCSLGGEHPSKDRLAAVMMDYDSRRSAVREARRYLCPRHYSETIAAFHRDGVNAPTTASTGKSVAGVPLAVVGGPLVQKDFWLFEVVEQAGGRVVLDATETGERSMPPPFDHQAVQNDPFMELTCAYFAGIPDAFRRPNSGFYKWLKQELQDRGVRGIIFRRHVWCDTWHAELRRLEEWADMPVIDIDGSNDDEGTRNRLTTRVQALLEVLV